MNQDNTLTNNDDAPKKTERAQPLTPVAAGVVAVFVLGVLGYLAVSYFSKTLDEFTPAHLNLPKDMVVGVPTPDDAAPLSIDGPDGYPVFEVKNAPEIAPENAVSGRVTLPATRPTPEKNMVSEGNYPLFNQVATSRDEPPPSDAVAGDPTPSSALPHNTEGPGDYPVFSF